MEIEGGCTTFERRSGVEPRWLVPILMTAAAAGLALIPLALRGGQSGSEIQTPMAIVILCGLTTSTVLNMFVVPTLYMKFGQPPVPSLNLEADER
jgi:Cu/Ag efflux pump CusA